MRFLKLSMLRAVSVPNNIDPIDQSLWLTIWPLQNHRKTDNSLIALFTLNTSTKISTILEIQLGKMLHSYKKSASNQGALYDSAKRNEVRQRLRLVFLSSTKGEIERWRFQWPVSDPVTNRWCMLDVTCISTRKTLIRTQIEKIREYSKKRLIATPKPKPTPVIKKHRRKTFKKLKSLFLHYVKYHPENKWVL